MNFVTYLCRVCNIKKGIKSNQSLPFIRELYVINKKLQYKKDPINQHKYIKITKQ